MTIVTCTYNPPGSDYKRINNFLISLRNSLLTVPEMKKKLAILIIMMGEPLPDMLIDYYAAYMDMLCVDSGIRDKRFARSVALIRHKIMRELVMKNDIVCTFDDDYALNPYALKFINMIYEENVQVDFLSVMKPNQNYPASYLTKLSGFLFWVTESCIGGATTYRWKEFRKYADDYFEYYETTPEGSGFKESFDQTFFPYIAERIGKPFFYHLMDFGLVQHCNYLSYWFKQRGGTARSHAYGDRFDPFINPFELRRFFR
jgi:hypothetical protein